MDTSTIEEIVFGERRLRVMYWHGHGGVRNVAWKLAGQGAWHPLSQRAAGRADFVVAAAEAAQTYVRAIERRRDRASTEDRRRTAAAT